MLLRNPLAGKQKGWQVNNSFFTFESEVIVVVTGSPGGCRTPDCSVHELARSTVAPDSHL